MDSFSVLAMLVAPLVASSSLAVPIDPLDDVSDADILASVWFSSELEEQTELDRLQVVVRDLLTDLSVDKDDDGDDEDDDANSGSSGDDDDEMDPV